MGRRVGICELYGEGFGGNLGVCEDKRRLEKRKE